MEELLRIFSNKYGVSCKLLENGSIEITMCTGDIKEAIDKVKEVSRSLFGIENRKDVIYNGKKF